MSAGTSYARHLAPEPALIPFRSVVSDERKLGSKNPPFASKRQIAAPHLIQRDILPLTDLGRVFSKSATQSALTYRGTLRCLADVNELLFEVEDVDSTGLWSYAFC